MKLFVTKLLPLLFCIALTQCKQKGPEYLVLNNWKFKTGDDKNWSKSNFDDSNWKVIQTNSIWENQGYANYDGYGWYRVKFNLPESLKKKALYKDTFQLVLGKIDDMDETYLNGEFIGTNNHVCSPDEAANYQKNTAYNVFRIYKLLSKDPRLKWGQENTLAVRVLDTGGGGGMYEGITSVGFKGLKDYLKINPTANGIIAVDSANYESNIEFQNLATFTSYEGELNIKIIDFETQQTILKYESEIKVPANGKASYSYKLPKDLSKQYIAEFSFLDKKSGAIITDSRDLPYILTPKAPATPRINGPRTIAVRPGKPLLFLVPASGQKPIRYEAASLPQGVTLDNETGILSGRIVKAGEYTVKIMVKNDKGESERDLKIVVGNKLSLTPPMGWNSWNCWGLSVNEEKMKNSIDIFIEKGLADYGWAYVNIDDGWEAEHRNADGTITPNEKFGNMKELSDYAHSKGLKLGIYSSPAPRTCGGFLGSGNTNNRMLKPTLNGASIT